MRSSGAVMPGFPTLSAVRIASNGAYWAFAGSVQGGLFPDLELMPPIKTGMNLRVWRLVNKQDL